MNSDNQIIERVLNGHTDSFGLLVEKYHERIFILSRGYVHGVEDAEDITQEVFIKAFMALGSFKLDSEFSSWLYRIGVNTALTFLRKKKIKYIFFFSEFVKEGKEDSFGYVDPKIEDTPQNELISKQTLEFIYNEIDKLPKRQREAFILSRIDQMSHKNISEIMSLSITAVDSLIQRAKKNLKTKLTLLINEND